MNAHNSGQDANRVLPEREAASYCGIPLSTWNKMRRKGETPTPIQLSPRRRGYTKSSLHEWRRARSKAKLDSVIKDGLEKLLESGDPLVQRAITVFAHNTVFGKWPDPENPGYYQYTRIKGSISQGEAFILPCNTEADAKYMHIMFGDFSPKLNDVIEGKLKAMKKKRERIA